jgi:hypothetical protein
MTGPEHYREAERLIANAAALGYGDGDRDTSGIVAVAQVHATLALAAATALLSDLSTYDDEPEQKAWRAAAGTEVDGG